MAKVSLKHETGGLILFCYPYWMGLALIAISVSFFLLSMSPAHEPAANEILVLSSIFGIVGLLATLYRLEVKFLPNNQTYSVKKGFWPLTKTRTGHYEELIGVVLTKKKIPTLSKSIEGEQFLWQASFAFTSIENPICYFESKDESEARYQFGRFAKHFHTKAFDRSDPLQIIETNWNELLLENSDSDQATQNLPEVDLENPPPDIRIEYGRAGFRIELPIQGFRFKFVLIFVSGLFLVGLSITLFFKFISSGDPNNVGLYLLISSFVGGFVNICTGAVGYYGKERVMFYKGTVHSDFIFLSTPFWEKEIPAHKVETIYLHEVSVESLFGKDLRDDSAPPESREAVSYELVIQSDFQRIRCGRHLEKDTLEWIRAALIHKIFDQEMAS